MEPFRKRPAGKLSGGMKQKLALMCTLLHKPRVLFLDEPTNGVDPVSRRDFWAILYQLVRDGLTVFVDHGVSGRSRARQSRRLDASGQTDPLRYSRGAEAQDLGARVSDHVRRISARRVEMLETAARRSDGAADGRAICICFVDPKRHLAGEAGASDAVRLAARSRRRSKTFLSRWSRESRRRQRAA